MKVPVSEVFDSVQGEGTYAGTAMRFIRLAGCSVGKHPESLESVRDRPIPATLQFLPSQKPAWVCWTYDCRPFCCDTDFRPKSYIDIKDTIRKSWQDHVCLTGGEPLIHEQAVHDALVTCGEEHKLLHIETSGTRPIPQYLQCDNVWITISPKLGFRNDAIFCADEIKLLVDDGFRIQDVPKVIMDHMCVFVQPVNGILDVERHNLQQCLDIIKQNPSWRLSVQLHKFLRVR